MDPWVFFFFKYLSFRHGGTVISAGGDTGTFSERAANLIYILWLEMAHY